MYGKNKKTEYKSLPARRGFSISEVVIAMTIILLFSVATASACYIGTTTQARSDNSASICNSARQIAWQFDLAKQTADLTTDSGKTAFIEDFNRRMAFALNCDVLTVPEDGESQTSDGALSCKVENGQYVWTYVLSSKKIVVTVASTDDGYSLAVAGSYAEKTVISL